MIAVSSGLRYSARVAGPSRQLRTLALAGSVVRIVSLLVMALSAPDQPGYLVAGAVGFGVGSLAIHVGWLSRVAPPALAGFRHLGMVMGGVVAAAGGWSFLLVAIGLTVVSVGFGTGALQPAGTPPFDQRRFRLLLIVAMVAAGAIAASIVAAGVWSSPALISLVVLALAEAGAAVLLPLSRPRGEMLRRLISLPVSVVMLVIRAFSEWLISFTRDARNPFPPLERFPWAADVEAGWKLVRQELDTVLQDLDRVPSFQQVSPEQESLTEDHRWKTFFFYAYGVRDEPNCRRCPETDRLLQRIPGMRSAMFSILLPHKHIPPHRGPYGGVLRLHLPLIVPESRDGARIRAGNQVRSWTEGRCLVLDDSLDHEAWNDTSEIRVVLFVDFLRPLPFPLSWWNRMVVGLMRWSPLIRGIQRNQKRWHAAMSQRTS